MELEKEFQEAVNRSKELTQRPANDELLDLYALYKQATEGDVTAEQPGGFDFKAIAKHNAWAGYRGKEKSDAMKDYIALMDRLYQQYR